MLTVTSTRPRERREEIRFLIDGSRAASSEPTRRCISRNLLLTVLRSTETEKSSPATIDLPYPVIDFMWFFIRRLHRLHRLNSSYLWDLRNLWILFFFRELELVELAVLPAL